MRVGRISWSLIVIVCVQLWAAEAQGITVSGGAARLRVDGVSPMLDALVMLSDKFGWKVGFEEARIQFAGDMVDVTSPKYVPKSKDDRAYTSRGGPLDVEFAVSARTGEPVSPEEVLRLVIASYQERGYPGRYAFQRADDGWLLVYPVEVRNVSGAWVRADPLSLVRTRMEAGEGEVLQKVFDRLRGQLGARCACKVGFGPIAINSLFRPARGVFRGGENDAELFIDQFCEIAGARFWRMVWLPDMKWYFISFGT